MVAAFSHWADRQMLQRLETALLQAPGAEPIGLSRRGFTPDTISQLKQAYRYLIQSKLNPTPAVAQSSAVSPAEIRSSAEITRRSRSA